MAAGWISRLLGKAASPRAGQSSFRGIDGEVVANIDREHLNSILTSASAHAGTIYEWFKGEYASSPLTAKASEKRRIIGMMRRAVTLRDSLDQVAALVRGEELAPPAPREWPWEDQEGPPLAVLDSVMESPGVQTDKPALTEEETQGAVTTHVAPLVDVEVMGLEPYSPLQTVMQVENKYKLREAHLYELIKQIRSGISADDTRGMANKCQEALDYIKGE